MAGASLSTARATALGVEPARAPDGVAYEDEPEPAVAPDDPEPDEAVLVA